MKIIPAIDIINGQCVRLSQGKYDTQKVYGTDPLVIAQRFEEAGIKYLHLVDLDGAKQGKIINGKILQSIATHTSLSIDFGGGVQSNKDLKIAFDLGARQVTCGSIAINQPGLVLEWVAKYGADKIILGADVNNKMIAINGWRDTTQMSIDALINQYMISGLDTVICTDISTDGMLQGTNVMLYSEILTKYPALKLIASGGVSSVDDLKMLMEHGLHGAIIGKALYENRISLQDLNKFINA